MDDSSLIDYINLEYDVLENVEWQDYYYFSTPGRIKLLKVIGVLNDVYKS
jgi:hypothetical protein